MNNDRNVQEAGSRGVLRTIQAKSAIPAAMQMAAA
jgi:hypothetical protein